MASKLLSTALKSAKAISFNSAALRLTPTSVAQSLLSGGAGRRDGLLRPRNAIRCLCTHYHELRRVTSPSLSSSILRTRRARAGRDLQRSDVRGFAIVAIDLPKQSHKSTSGQLDPAPETQQSCTIKVIDYSSKRITHHDVAGTSRDLESFLTGTPKPTWAACRWIYVNGLDHEVIKSLGQARDLHRLAIEDVLERSAPSKVDWYSNNCFMVLAWQRLVNNAHRHSLTEVFHDESPDAEAQGTLSPIQRGLRHRMKWCSTSHREFGLSSEHVSAFMTSDNTIITIFEGAGEGG
ncbi:hypothetical protein LTR95_005925, partial [Oleoguttula sp. CCFEE 5521]